MTKRSAAQSDGEAVSFPQGGLWALCALTARSESVQKGGEHKGGFNDMKAAR